MTKKKKNKKNYSLCKELRNLFEKLMKVWSLLHAHLFLSPTQQDQGAIALSLGLSCPYMHTHKYFRSSVTVHWKIGSYVATKPICG